MSHSEQLSEQELIRLIGLGDENAFTVIYQRYFRMLYSFAISIVKNPDDAGDHVQDVFLTLCIKSKANDLHIHTSLKSFLHQSLRNRIYNNLDRVRVKERFYIVLQHQVTELVHATENYISEKETRNELKAGIAELPELTREIFLLKTEDELSHKEICEKKNISPATVKRHLSQATRFLQAKLTSLLFLF